MGIKIGNNNPILSYKLDRIATSSTAMLSVEHAAGHESGNVVRARANAVANGGYVIYSAITLDMRKRGMFLAAVAGKTTVEIYYPHGKGKLGERKNNSKIPTRSVERRLEEDLNIFKSRMNSEKNDDVRENIKRRISEIRNAIMTLRMGRIPTCNVKSLVDAYA